MEDVSISDEHWNGTAKEMHKRADAIMRTFTTANNPELGEVHFTGKGRAKHCLTSGRRMNSNPCKLFRNWWNKATLHRLCPTAKGRPDIVAVHKIEHGLKIGEAKYSVEITVRETKAELKSAFQFYLHRIT